ncbi:hypothetical protein LOTGIDRAFT_203892 [Lottia gigantea]|uniref:Enolase 4 n=1 Tax=Lottia gigantea TaxID=225164 RepID=V4AK88_LOTGI|nr:hypothetical protein LOTGIDRAFT_203892 [Lottia gigantea]ESO95150.1 hypothetical protein LOTGIDRAFT_203892 [Lottia gigantea]
MAAVNDKKSEKSKQDYYDTKQQAMEYYSENGVPIKMEEILNSMFYDNPYDVYGYLANYFEKYAKTPSITKIKSRTALDSRGQPSLQTSVYCTVKNIEKCLATVVSSNPQPHVLDNGKTEDKEKEEQERKEDIEAGIELIESEISEKLKELDPCHQQEIDQLLYDFISQKKAEKDAEASSNDENKSPSPQPAVPPSVDSPSKKKLASGKKGKAASVIIVVPDEPREGFLSGSSIVSSLSQAICCTGASISNQPLYQYIASLFNKSTDKYHLPLPMTTILQAGKASSGKLKCVKEFMLIPKPSMSVSEAMNYIQEIYNHIGKSFLHKSGVSGRYVNDIGALCPILEKVEQGLDLLQEAITSVG